MASKRFQKGDIEWMLFQDYWKMCQKFWIAEEPDEYWDQVINAVKDFYEKYKNDEPIFAKEIVFAFLNTLDKKIKLENRK